VGLAKNNEGTAPVEKIKKCLSSWLSADWTFWEGFEKKESRLRDVGTYRKARGSSGRRPDDNASIHSDTAAPLKSTGGRSTMVRAMIQINS
jgi:hypothetical protein